MNEIQLALGIDALFAGRIGLPMLILGLVGILIDQWQGKRDRDVGHKLPKP